MSHRIEIPAAAACSVFTLFRCGECNAVTARDVEEERRFEKIKTTEDQWPSHEYIQEFCPACGESASHWPLSPVVFIGYGGR